MEKSRSSNLCREFPNLMAIFGTDLPPKNGLFFLIVSVENWRRTMASKFGGSVRSGGAEDVAERVRRHHYRTWLHVAQGMERGWARDIVNR